MFRYFLIYFLFQTYAFAAGHLSDNFRISSDVLGYDIQYRVYTPENIENLNDIPSIYVTDGHDYIKHGRMVKVLDRLIAAGKMKPVVAVFVDARDPDNLKINRRKDELWCNENYARFYVTELVKQIEQNYPVSQSRDDRVIQGVSFGGFNAACFGLMAYGTFSGISMHSPANSYFLKLLTEEYKKADHLPLKMFMSVGNENDNRRAVRRFKRQLDEKGYDLNYIQVNKDHVWENWRPLMDDALLTFFATR
ncbi:alpha/beta hydrolase [Pseudemcibacter aquimaris]|uniref:alpha/beta hydrolase n=1 Tax=Pseudemcibacter aquimaris TaxID=2857064 RepID=UPI0020117ED7|nr:alpha/beta hydrolase-fold protein [Pseudemcibacter aquimaris]MCC3859956.1 hypothetical protein [Pseudemcibacter aquimaris]WDU57288.1 hypothetical protein KW060_08760 [Pseudemcibacter aquimaris]